MIIGEKTILAGIQKDDFDFLYNCSNDYNLKSLTGTLFPISEYEHEKWISTRNENIFNKLFIILDKDTKDRVGSIGLKNIDYVNSNAELYITLASAFIGKKGYGSSAIKSLINFCFDRLNLHKVYLHVFETNLKAIECYKKCGMKIEGKLVDQHYENGQYISVFIMSIIREGF